MVVAGVSCEGPFTDEDWLPVEDDSKSNNHSFKLRLPEDEKQKKTRQ
jgi:hypothetical protein